MGLAGTTRGQAANDRKVIFDGSQGISKFVVGSIALCGAIETDRWSIPCGGRIRHAYLTAFDQRRLVS